MDRPDYVKKEHLIFLDALKESGITNMYGARPYLMQEFHDLKGEEARKIMSYWMETLDKDTR